MHRHYPGSKQDDYILVAICPERPIIDLALTEFVQHCRENVIVLYFSDERSSSASDFSLKYWDPTQNLSYMSALSDQFKNPRSYIAYSIRLVLSFEDAHAQMRDMATSAAARGCSGAFCLMENYRSRHSYTLYCFEFVGSVNCANPLGVAPEFIPSSFGSWFHDDVQLNEMSDPSPLPVASALEAILNADPAGAVFARKVPVGAAADAAAAEPTGNGNSISFGIILDVLRATNWALRSATEALAEHHGAIAPQIDGVEMIQRLAFSEPLSE
eukprot:c12825_g1_i2.p1 GENE.c12825_g1_i2~~c12825_g1_i2.p1  ORF type:complete len:271 (+),score=18.33 c12825_g1_i2:745-1557(+)